MQFWTRTLKSLACTGEVGNESVGKPGTATVLVGLVGARGDTDGGGFVCCGGGSCADDTVVGGVLDPMAGVVGGGSVGAVTVGGGLGCGELPTRSGGILSIADGIGGGALLDAGNGGAAGALAWAAAGFVENSNVI